MNRDEQLDYDELPEFAANIIATLETSQSPVTLALSGGALGVMSVISPEVLVMFLDWLHRRRNETGE
jgi:hypothetical protein